MTHISFQNAVSIHQALADPLRILLIRLLLERELCVCELVDALEEPQYKISRHLGILKRAGLDYVAALIHVVVDRQTAFENVGLPRQKPPTPGTSG